MKSSSTAVGKYLDKSSAIKRTRPDTTRDRFVEKKMKLAKP